MEALKGRTCAPSGHSVATARHGVVVTDEEYQRLRVRVALADVSLCLLMPAATKSVPYQTP